VGCSTWGAPDTDLLDRFAGVWACTRVLASYSSLAKIRFSGHIAFGLSNSVFRVLRKEEKYAF
jgi:hypothetical protein